MRAPASVAIVGGSLAGARCAGGLRRGGFAGSITIVSGEERLPYDRPPLSKQFLAGEWDADRTRLFNEEKFAGLDVDWNGGVKASALDKTSRTVELADGRLVSADVVVIATGASPRTLPQAEGLGGVHVLRNLDDAIALRADLVDGRRSVVVVGAGFIGSEVAATSRGLGHRVTIVEAADVPMQRGVGEQMGLLCGSLHGDHGVDLRLSAGVETISSRADPSGVERVRSVGLADGSELEADVLVVGIGVSPNTDWLTGSGLEIGDGVICNSFCEAAPGVYAAGDVARWPNELFEEVMRVEHWENAVEQAGYVAKRILGAVDEPYAPVPWFWSDQYEHKIQVAGRPHAGDVVEVVSGSIEEKRFASIYGRGDRLTGVFGLNRPRQVMQFRQLIADRASWTEALDFAEAAG